ncbi:MAG: hypothetical protein ABL895_05855 [Cyclobacteriaceae bacterium]
MYFSKTSNLNANQIIKVIELRNYLLKPNLLDRFQRFFQDHFIESQNILNGYILGQFQIEEIDNRFFWIRGFHDMASRMNFLKSFYDQSITWKKYGPEANDMMLNSDQVHLLRPLNSTGDWQSPSHGIILNDFLAKNKMIVIDYYHARPGKLDELIEQFRAVYVPNPDQEMGNNITLWIAEQTKSEFRHPVIQDTNLLVSIRAFVNKENYFEHDKKDTKVSRLLGGKESVVLYQFQE